MATDPIHENKSMLDIQELEARSGETSLVRRLDRRNLDTLKQANRRLAKQNARVLQVADDLLLRLGDRSPAARRSRRWPRLLGFLPRKR